MLQAYTETPWVRRRGWCLPALVLAIGAHVAILAALFLATRWPIAKVEIEPTTVMVGLGSWRPAIQPDYMVCDSRPCRSSGGCVLDCPAPCRPLLDGGRDWPGFGPVVWKEQLVGFGRAHQVAEATVCIDPDGAVRSVSMRRSSGSRQLDRLIVRRLRAWRYDVPAGPAWLEPGDCPTLTILGRDD